MIQLSVTSTIDERERKRERKRKGFFENRMNIRSWKLEGKEGEDIYRESRFMNMIENRKKLKNEIIYYF